MEFMVNDRPGGRRQHKTAAPKSFCPLCGAKGAWERSKWNLIEHQKREVCRKNRGLNTVPTAARARRNQIDPDPFYSQSISTPSCLPLYSPQLHHSGLSLGLFESLEDTFYAPQVFHQANADELLAALDVADPYPWTTNGSTAAMMPGAQSVGLVSSESDANISQPELPNDVDFQYAPPPPPFDGSSESGSIYPFLSFPEQYATPVDSTNSFNAVQLTALVDGANFEQRSDDVVSLPFSTFNPRHPSFDEGAADATIVNARDEDQQSERSAKRKRYASPDYDFSPFASQEHLVQELRNKVQKIEEENVLLKEQIETQKKAATNNGFFASILPSWSQLQEAQFDISASGP